MKTTLDLEKYLDTIHSDFGNPEAMENVLERAKIPVGIYQKYILEMFPHLTDWMIEQRHDPQIFYEWLMFIKTHVLIGAVAERNNLP